MTRRIAMIALTLVLLLLPAIVVAEERTAVFQANLTVPVIGARTLGTLTITYDDATGVGTWSYQGTLDGQPAMASGSGTAQVDTGVAGETVLEISMTSVDEWQIPGIDAYTPRSATIRAVGNLAYVNYDGPIYDLFGIPVAIAPELSIPVEGIYVLTDPGTGEEPIVVIPGTGVGPGERRSSVVSSPNGIVVVVAIAALGIGVLMHRRRLHAR